MPVLHAYTGATSIYRYCMCMYMYILVIQLYMHMPVLHVYIGTVCLVYAILNLHLHIIHHVRVNQLAWLYPHGTNLVLESTCRAVKKLTGLYYIKEKLRSRTRLRTLFKFYSVPYFISKAHPEYLYTIWTGIFSPEHS